MVYIKQNQRMEQVVGLYMQYKYTHAVEIYPHANKYNSVSMVSVWI